MCIGNRKTATITIRNVYTTIAPSSATGYLVLLFISVSIILLGITLLPEIFIYETDFTDTVMVILDDGNVQGVTKILVRITAFYLATTNFVSSSRI